MVDEESAAVSDLIEAGSAMTGALAGAAIGLVGGPPGAVAGAALGGGLAVGLKRIGLEVRKRLLGPREAARIGATLTYAITAAQERLDSGEALRADGFFAADPTASAGRSAAEEAIEGVLIASQREYEERKLVLYGRLLASIAFRTDVSRAHANYLIGEVQGLSYRQLALLAQSCRGAIARLSLSGVAIEDARNNEIDDLFMRHLVRMVPGHNDQLEAWSNGTLLCELLDLSSLTDAEITSVVALALTADLVDDVGIEDQVQPCGGPLAKRCTL
jgi:hypothetical protein